MKIKLFQLFMIGSASFLISCNASNSADLDKKLTELGDTQQLLLKKLQTMEKSIANIALANKNKPADKKTPPKADPNKVYNIPIGDSFTKGPANAAVTLIEWTDFQ